MPTRRVITGVAIEGFGLDTTRALGLTLYNGLHTPAGSQRQWLPALEGVPQSISTSVDPFNAQVNTSSFTFRLSATDTVAQALMWSALGPSHRVAISDVPVGGSTVILEAAASYPQSGEVVWIGDEALFVISESGGTLTVQRGYWGTTAQSHLVGDDLFTSVPYWRGRGVTLIEQDVDTGTERAYWSGLIEDIDQDGPLIILRARETLGALLSSTLNDASPRIRSHNFSWDATGQLLGTLTEYTPRVTRNDGVSLPPVYLQVDTALVRCIAYGDGLVSPITVEYGDTLLGSLPPIEIGVDAPASTPAEDVCEVAVWRRDSGSLTSGDAPTTGVTSPFHPLTIVLELLTSTGRGDNGAFDVLGEEWGAGVRYIDWTRWATEIANTPELVIDRLVLGWDFEPVEPLEVARRVMRAFGYFFGRSVEGLLTPARLRMVTEADLDGGLALGLYADGPLRLARRLAQTPSQITGLVGNLPWDDGTRVVARVASRSSRGARLLDRRRYELDLSVFDPARVVSDGVIDSEEFTLLALLKLGLDQAPTLYGRVPDPQELGGSGVLELGGVVSANDLGGIQNAWLVDGQGQRVTITSGAQWAGIIVERRRIIENGTYELGILLTNWRAGKAIKERAPSAVVGVGSSTTVMELDATESHGTEPGLAFDVDDEVSIATALGVRTSSTVTVTARTATTLTVSPALASAPVAGELVRLPQSANFDSGRYASVTARPVAYLAPNASTPIEDATTTLEGPDVFGTEVYPGAGSSPSTPAVFARVDSDAVTSASSSTAEPWDSWISHTMRDNESEMITRGQQVAWAPLVAQAGNYSGFLGHRAYASAARSTILMVPWFVQPGLEQIRISHIARIATETSDALERAGADYFMSLEVGPRGLPSASQTEAYSNTQLETPQAQPKDITLDTTGAAAGLGALTLWGQSRVDHWSSTAFSGFVQFATGSLVESAAAAPYVDTTSPRPNANALDTMITELGGVVLHEHVQPLDVVGRKMASVGGGPPPDDSATLDIRYLPYAQIKGLEIHETYADVDYTADTTLEPRRPVLAEVDVLHLARAERLQRRLRPIWVGPQGTRPGASTGEGWPADITQRWVLQSAKDAAVDSVTMTAPVLVDATNTRLTMLAYVLPIHDLNGSYIRPDPFASASVAQWDMWLQVEQLEDGDAGWPDANTVSTNALNKTRVQLAHVPAVADGQFPALYQHQLRRANNRWPLKEGQLFDQDLPFVQDVGLAIDVGAGFDFTRPARIVLNMEWVSVEWNETVNRTSDGLDLLIVGASLWRSNL